MNNIDTNRSNGFPPGHQNWVSILRFGMVAALALLFASTAPPGLVVATFSSLLFLSAVGIATVAAVVGESAFADHLTRWDEVAAFMLLSMVAAWMVDPDQVRLIVDSLPPG